MSLLALEEELKGVDDPFLVKGVTLAIDGTDPDEVRDILEAEVHATKAHGKHSAKFFADAGAYGMAMANTYNLRPLPAEDTLDD